LARFAASDATCHVGAIRTGTSGSVQLTSASAQAGGLIEGTFSATLDSGDALSGSVSARLQVCGTADAGSPVCK
jgi:hypothetical protein